MAEKKQKNQAKRNDGAAAVATEDNLTLSYGDYFHCNPSETRSQRHDAPAAESERRSNVRQDGCRRPRRFPPPPPPRLPFVSAPFSSLIAREAASPDLHPTCWRISSHLRSLDAPAKRNKTGGSQKWKWNRGKREKLKVVGERNKF